MRNTGMLRTGSVSLAATRRRRAWIGAPGLVLLLVLAPATRAQGVQLAVMPQITNVVQGTGFDLELDVTAAGSLFNGFDAVVGYDPAALTFVPASPVSLQEGAYMTSACGTTPFHMFGSAGDSLSISLILLCKDTSLPGPGQVYKLHFVASNTPQMTTVHIRNATFYNAGLFVQPVLTQDATVVIGSVSGVGRIAGRVVARLSALPNPCVAGTTIRVEAPSAIERDLVVCDLSGRVVRHLAAGSFGPGTRTVAWDGNGDRGERLPAGVYFARLAGGPGAPPVRIALLR